MTAQGIQHQDSPALVAIAWVVMGLCMIGTAWFYAVLISAILS